MTINVTAILVGHRNDRGFVQEGYQGLLRAKENLDINLDIVDHIENDAVLLESRVLQAAENGARGIIVHGSRANSAIDAIAPHWTDVSFLSPGGSSEGPNVWNYAVRHFEASFLAGILAGNMTRSGIVGHLSGVPISPGKKARAAFVQGVEYTNPDIRVLTAFCGNQDDPELARHWIEAEIHEGADIIFTMLNYGRSGTIESCRSAGIWQIGNIRDWTIEEPEVFIGSAIAGHGWSILWWLEDLVAGKLIAGSNRHHGLEMPEAVRLAMSPQVPTQVQQKIEDCTAKILSKEIKINAIYNGPEFTA